MKSTGSLPETVSHALEAFIPQLKVTYGESLLMTVLYGSAAAGSWVKGVSDVNILAVVDKADPERLIALGKKARKTIEKYRITLHLLSKQELLTSSDIFPVEYLELQDAMVLLQGANLFSEMSIEAVNLRHQVESMLRGGVQTLRRILIMTAGRNKQLLSALKDWSGSQLSLMKALERLTRSGSDNGSGGMNAYRNPAELATLLGERLNIDSQPLLELLELRTQTAEPDSAEKTATAVQARYLALLEVVDTYEAKN